MDEIPEDDAGGPVKRFMYVNRRAPHGTIYAQESLEVVLIGAAFEQDVSLVFVDDGVYQIHKGQDPQALGTKNFSNIHVVYQSCFPDADCNSGISTLVDRAVGRYRIAAPRPMLN